MSPALPGRRGVEDLDVPHSLLDGMPALYRSDDFLVRWISAFDQVLAPVHAVVDNIDAYVDPYLAPDDFLAWLATWVGVAVDERWPVRHRRELIAAAAQLYRWRGTVRGIESAVAIYTGLVPEVIESGGCQYSPMPGAPPPGSARPHLLVRLRVGERDVDRDAIDAIVDAAKPAHIPHDIEIIEL